MKEGETFPRYQSFYGNFFKERGISQDLIDRIAVGCILDLPGFDTEELKEVKADADKAQRSNEIKYRWYRVAAYVQKCYEKSGYVWEKCRTNREIEIDRKLEARLLVKQAIDSAPEKYCSVAEAMELLTLTREQLVELNTGGHIKVFRVGADWFLWRADVEKLAQPASAASGFRKEILDKAKGHGGHPVHQASPAPASPVVHSRPSNPKRPAKESKDATQRAVSAGK